MRYLLAFAVTIAAACHTEELRPDAYMPPLTGPAPCSAYIALYSNTTPGWQHSDEFIAPLGASVIVDGGNFRSLDGVSYPQPNDTTLVLAGKEYHFADGTVERGAVGMRGIQNICEWARAIE